MPFPAVPLAALAVGAIAGGLREKLGHRGKFKQMPTVSPEAKRAMDWASQRGQNMINNPYQGFEPIANAANAVWRQETLPQAKESWMSSNGQTDLASGSFGSQIGAFQRAFANDLAALQAQYGMQRTNQGMNLMNIGTRPVFENTFFPARETMLSGAIGGLGNAATYMGGAGLADWYDNYMNTPDAVKGSGGGGDTVNKGVNPSAAASEQDLRSQYLRMKGRQEWSGSAGNPFNYWAAPEELPTTKKDMAWASMTNAAANPFAGWNPSQQVGGRAAYLQTPRDRAMQSADEFLASQRGLGYGYLLNPLSYTPGRIWNAGGY